MVIGALELGGTKTIAALFGEGDAPLAQHRLATRGGEDTLAEAETFFRTAGKEHGALGALGIASFGPIDLNRGSPGWGHVFDTVKPGWSRCDIGGRLSRALACPVVLDTDVNAAALAEARLGAGKGLDPLVYLTVGTGIGGGLVVRGKPVHGLMHPEMGHVPLRRHADDDFRGCCPYHGDCAEGLASGPAIVARFGCTLDGLAVDHPFRAILTDYLGQLCASVVLIASPRRIVLGGGVMAGSRLHDEVTAAMLRWLGGYVPALALDATGYVSPPGFEDAGLVGAMLMAREIQTTGR